LNEARCADASHFAEPRRDRPRRRDEASGNGAKRRSVRASRLLQNASTPIGPHGPHEGEPQ